MEGDPWAEIEAMEDERFEADLLQAQYEAEGREHGRRERLMRKLYAEGKLAEAAEACPHGGGYPLDSEAAANEHDPFVGEAGVRCTTCGSRLTAFSWDHGKVLFPMEEAKRWVK